MVVRVVIGAAFSHTCCLFFVLYFCQNLSLKSLLVVFLTTCGPNNDKIVIIYKYKNSRKENSKTEIQRRIKTRANKHRFLVDQPLPAALIRGISLCSLSLDNFVLNFSILSLKVVFASFFASCFSLSLCFARNLF
jgi:hypothetical protein